MGLIDANKLIECKFKNPISYAAFCNLVKRQPTVDAVPAVHGRWLDGYRFQMCSSCKYRGKKSWKYCPNCGADMRGEQE